MSTNPREAAATTFCLNGVPRTCRSGTTILEALNQAGVHLPQLCHDPRIAPAGVCRSCLVHVEGIEHPVVACATAIADGMHIVSQGPAIDAARAGVLDLLVHRYPRLQEGLDNELLRELRAAGMEQGPSPREPPIQVDDAHPYIRVDMARCISCRRCERICREVQGQCTWQLWGRGTEVRLVPDSGSSLRTSSCVSCGACVDSCPSGALQDKTSLTLGAPQAWTRTTCPYCGVGCELMVGTRDDRIVQVRPALDAPVNKGHLCVKGRYAFGFVDAPDRLRTPLIRRAGRLQAVSWDEALEHVAHALDAIRRKHGPDAIGVLGSARATNEENYLTQKFARVVLGTNNVDCCARVCHAPSAAALSAMLGTGAATNSFDDIERARTILVVGANTTESHPIVGARIRQAVWRGARLIVIDPRRTELASFATLHLAVRPGQNVPLLNALAWTIVREGLADQPFLQARVDGHQAFCEHIAAYEPERVAAACGVSAEAIRAAARMYAQQTPSMALHGLGVTEHVQGTEAVMCIVNLALLTGNIGKPGTGVNPLRGQNNVQGSAHMGCEPLHLTGYTPLEAGRGVFEKAWRTPLPTRPGLDSMEMIDAAQAGSLKALYAIGYDVLLTNPDAEHTRAGLAQLELIVVQDLFLSSLASELAHVVLPAASAFEKDGTFMNAERRVQRVRRAVKPRGEARSDADILCTLAAAMGHAEGFRYRDAEAIWDEVRSVWGAGAGISYGRLESGGLQWPCPHEAHPGTGLLHGERFTAGSRASLRCVTDRGSSERPDANYPFVLITGRRLFQFNAGTMTARTPNSELQLGDSLDMAPADAARLGLKSGDYVRLVSRTGQATLKVRVDASVRPSELFTTFHTSEACVNRLTHDRRDPVTHTPAYKVTAVRVERLTNR